MKFDPVFKEIGLHSRKVDDQYLKEHVDALHSMFSIVHESFGLTVVFTAIAYMTASNSNGEIPNPFFVPRKSGWHNRRRHPSPIMQEVLTKDREYNPAEIETLMTRIREEYPEFLLLVKTISKKFRKHFKGNEISEHEWAGIIAAVMIPFRNIFNENNDSYVFFDVLRILPTTGRVAFEIGLIRSQLGLKFKRYLKNELNPEFKRKLNKLRQQIEEEKKKMKKVKEVIENEAKIFVLGASRKADTLNEIFDEILLIDENQYKQSPKLSSQYSRVERYTTKVRNTKKSFRIVTDLNDDLSPIEERYELGIKEKLDGESVRNEKTLVVKSREAVDFIVSDLLDAKDKMDGIKLRRKAKLNHKSLILTLDTWITGPLKGLMYFEVESNSAGINIEKEIHRLFYVSDFDYEISYESTMKLVKKVHKYEHSMYYIPEEDPKEVVTQESSEEIVEETKSSIVSA